jgi:hypothetical protein
MPRVRCASRLGRPSIGRALRTAGSLAAVLLIAAPPLAAQGAPIDFSAYASPVTTEYQATVGRPVTVGGFDFFAYRAPGARNVLGTWGTDPAADPDGALNLPSNRGGATALYGTQAGEIVDMYAAGQFFNPPATFATFNLFGMDVAHLYAQQYLPFGTTLQPFTLTFFGFTVRGANATVQQSFVVPAPSSGAPFLNSLQFDARWRGLYQVAWQQSTAGSGQFHQFTNVSAAVVPEPSTVLLVGTGVLLIAAGTRRRRRA